MQFRNTNESFGLVSKFFHWAAAVIVLTLLSVGFLMTGLEFSPFKLNIYMLHKSFGILVLVLVIGRAFWRLATPRPDPLPTHAKWENTLAKTVHFALYACLILMPLSGWVMSSAGGFPAEFFNLFPLPALTGKDEDLFELTRDIHTVTAWGLLILLALHFAGAFKHHFIDRDATLQRMTSRKVDLYWGILFVALAGLLWTSPVALALFSDDAEGKSEIESLQDSNSGNEGRNEVLREEVKALDDSDGWLIDAANSSIKFEATQYGEKFQGEFKNFGGRIIFDPKKLDDAYADIWIDISSIATGSSDRDGQAKSTEWFDTENFPRAIFVADSFMQTGPNRYVARGALTIRGQAAMVELPFTLQIRESPDGQTALMESNITLNRLDFGIGQGQWQSTDAIGDAVQIAITVVADSH